VTRHNAGFLLTDVLAEQWRLPRFRRSGNVLTTQGRRGRVAVTLVKPQTFMNLSGEALRPMLSGAGFDPLADLLILVDDTALPLGSFRLRSRGSAGGHNGLRSVEEAVGGDGYGRLRIGVGPLPADVDDQADFVLSPFSDEQLTAYADLLPTLVDAVDCWLSEGMDAAMNRFNRRIADSTDPGSGD
jgi:PTH1 family peptidyl-tRNA hydrolase